MIPKEKAALCTVLTGACLLSGCGDKEPKVIEGRGVSVPAAMSLEDLMGGGEIKNLQFSGETMKVRLESGEEIEARATVKQMEQAFRGRNRVTLEKTESGEWTVVKCSGAEDARPARTRSKFFGLSRDGRIASKGRG